MATNPTFNLTALTSKAARAIPRSPGSRDYFETMPGADGEFVQPHGTAGRDIMVGGILQASAASAALAYAALMTLFRTKQDLVSSAVATFVGTDSNSYTNCSLLSYDMAGATQTFQSAASTWTSLCPIRALVRNHTP